MRAYHGRLLFIAACVCVCVNRTWYLTPKCFFFLRARGTAALKRCVRVAHRSVRGMPVYPGTYTYILNILCGLLIVALVI